MSRTYTIKECPGNPHVIGMRLQVDTEGKAKGTGIALTGFVPPGGWGAGPWPTTLRNDRDTVLELLDAVPTVAKDTNPKDAIGDTKVPYFLLSAVAKAEWALAQFAGMLKYGSWNWRSAGVRSSVYLSAMERHLEAYKSGEELDPVDGSHHLGNIMACAAILIDAKAAGKLNDDRPPSVDLRPTFARVEAQMAVLKAQYKDKAPYHHTIKDTNAST